MTEKKIFELMKWYITRPKQIQIEIWKAFGTQDAEKERQKFAQAIKAIKDKMQRDKRKYLDREQGFKELEHTTKLRIASIRKPRKKKTTRKGKLKRKMQYRFKLIEQLRSQGLGWRLIARYLAKYADLQISHVHLRRLYLQIQKDQQQQKTDDQDVKIIRTEDPNIVIRKR